MTSVLRFTERDCERLTRGLLDQNEVAALGQDNVRAILSEKGRTQYVNMPDAVLAADPDGTKRVARYVMITESALPPFDRVILMNGIKLDEFKGRGAPLLFSHGDAPFPLGTVTNIDTGAMAGRGRKGRKAMTGDADFLAAEHWEFAALTWEMVQAGILRGGSIGFDLVDEREPTKEEVQQFGIKSQFGTIATKINLVEFSVVPLGRDPGAQVIGRVRNHYSRRLDALCAEGVCSRGGADDFLERVLGARPHPTSYVSAPANGWAQGTGLELRTPQQHTRAQEGGMECTTCGSATCNGGCAPDQYTANDQAPDLRQLASLQQRIDTLSGELAAVGEDLASTQGVVNAQRTELRSLRARVASGEAEFREAFSQRPIVNPNGYTPVYGVPPETNVEVEFADLSEDDQDESCAGELLAQLEEGD